MEDRRRSARVIPERDTFVRVSVRRPVQVLDLSAGGSLLAASALASEAPTSGALQMSLGGAPFTAQVRVTRVERQAGQPRMFVGVAFTSIDEAGSQALDEVLGRSTR